MKKRRWVIGVIGLFMIGMQVGSVECRAADTLLLKNGRELVGIIQSNEPGKKYVVIQTAMGVLKVPRTKIERVEQQENISYTEASADLAITEGDLDRALDLYQKALETHPGQERIKQKIEQTRQKIYERDQSIYGSSFNKIEHALSNQDFSAALTAARELFQQVEKPAARERCRRLISEAYMGLARQRLNVVDYVDAEKYFLKAQQAYEKNPRPYLEWGDMIQWAHTRKGKAIELYRQGIKLAMENGGLISEAQLLDYRFKLGRLLHENAQFKQAADVLLNVIQDDEDIQYPQAVDLAVEAYSRLRAQSSEDELNEIIADLKSLIALKPNEEMAYLLLGRIYYDQQNWQKAADMLETAVMNFGSGRGNVASRDALYYLGIAHRQMNNIDEAAKWFSKLVTQMSGNYAAYCELAEIRMEQGAYEAALPLFNDAIALDQDKYRAYFGKAKVLLLMKRFEEARENFKEVIAREPEHVEAQLEIAKTYYNEEQSGATVREAEKTVQLLDDVATEERTPKQRDILAEAYTLMGNANLNLKKINLSRENFEAALDIKPGYAPALSGMGKAYQADGRHNEAEQYFQDAIEAEPGNPKYYLRLGINWHHYRRNSNKALPYYQKYLELGGKDPQVRDWIAEIGGELPSGTN